MTEIVKRRLLIISIVVSLLPIGVLIHAPVITSLRTWALYGSAIAGYAGVVLLLWMYILGTRATSRAFFTDTAPILTIHGWLGKYGSIAILLHPLLVIYSYGESLLYAVVPRLGTEFERHVTLGRISFILVVIVWVSSALLRGKLAYRPWKYLHYLGYICLPFALLHVPDVGSAYMSSAVVKLYYFSLVLATLVFTMFRLRSLLNLDRYRYTIIRQQQLMDDTFLLTLKPHESYVVPKRGQCVYLKLGFVSEDHPFSIVQYHERTHEITLAYRVFGTFTDSLSQYEAGDHILLDGRYGEFTAQVTQHDRPNVFIAGGIGITPFVDHILRGDDEDSRLFYASPSQDRTTFLNVLREEMGDRFVPMYSQDHAATHAEHGRINADILRRHLDDPSRYNYFICGPEGMINTARQSLISLGVSKNQIFTEEFGF